MAGAGVSDHDRQVTSFPSRDDLPLRARGLVAATAACDVALRTGGALRPRLRRSPHDPLH